MRSLRGRLTLGVVFVLAVVLGVAFAVTSRSVGSSERAALDDRLERTAALSRATARLELQTGLPADDRRLDNVLRGTGSSLRLVLGARELLQAGVDVPPHAPLRRGLQTFGAGGRRYRAFVTTLSDRTLGSARLEVISSLRGIERRQAALRRRILLLGVIALVVAGAGVWLAADLVLRPLRRLRDVTSAVAEEEDLDHRVPTDDGPVELRSLAASFNAMLARLGRSAADRERALAATRRFAADAGHELRTPLTSVQATLSALGRHPDLDAQRRTAMVGDALAEQRRLVDLLDGLQALARGDAGPLEQTEVDLAEVVDAAVTAAAARHPETEIAARLPEGAVSVAGWEPGLRLLAENLVENAARHGRPGGRVAVTLGSGGAAGGGPVLEVDDDGPGVPPEQRGRIFEPFARVDGTDRPGSGLGLALVAQQARHHGATVEVGDAPLGGARFTVRFGG